MIAGNWTLVWAGASLCSIGLAYALYKIKQVELRFAMRYAYIDLVEELRASYEWSQFERAHERDPATITHIIQHLETGGSAVAWSAS